MLQKGAPVIRIQRLHIMNPHNKNMAVVAFTVSCAELELYSFFFTFFNCQDSWFFTAVSDSTGSAGFARSWQLFSWSPTPRASALPEQICSEEDWPSTSGCWFCSLDLSTFGLEYELPEISISRSSSSMLLWGSRSHFWMHNVNKFNISKQVISTLFFWRVIYTKSR